MPEQGISVITSHDLRIFEEVYLALEDDFMATHKYVHICSDNRNTYSMEFLKQLLSIGAEIDVTTKELAKLIAPKHEYRHMKQRREVILKAYPWFYDVVLSPQDRFQTKEVDSLMTPWCEWKLPEPGEKPVEQIPKWWNAYNHVKHHRNDYFKEANLQNVLDALGALFVVVKTLHYFFKAQLSVAVFPIGDYYEVGTKYFRIAQLVNPNPLSD